MARKLRSLAVVALVAALGVGLASSVATSAQQQDPEKGAAKSKKGKAARKATKPAAAPAPEAATSADPGALKFSRDIAPILVANCARCHNAAHRSGLSQVSFASLMKGGKAGPAIAPGNPEGSLLVERIKGEEGPKMPPGNVPLTDNAVEKISRWIKEGARLDAGVDATAPMAKYAATPEDLRKAEIARLSPADRDKKTEATARDRLKKADPKAEPEVTASAHFLLFGEMPKERAVALLKGMEAQHAKVGRLLVGGKGLAGPEKIGIYAFKERRGFTEFVRTVENQEVEGDEQARAHLNVESPYLIAIDPLAGAAEPAGTAARKASRTKKGADDSPGGPERSLLGLLAEQLAAGALAQAGKPPRWVTAGFGAYIASQAEPRSPYYRRLRSDAFQLYREGWSTKANEALGDQAKPEAVRAVGFAVAEWLAAVNPTAVPTFLQAMIEGGEKLDGAVNGCFNITREQFLQGSGEFVAESYGRAR